MEDLYVSLFPLPGSLWVANSPLYFFDFRSNLDPRANVTVP